jgi:hypothetical protein
MFGLWASSNIARYIIQVVNWMLCVFCIGKILFWTNLMIMRRKMMKMDKMENVDFVRQRYATILRGSYSHSQIEVVALPNLNIMSLTKPLLGG